MRFRSISTSLLTGLVVSTTALLLADAVITYSNYRQQVEQHRIADLALYVQARTRIVALSANALPEHIAEALAAGWTPTWPSPSARTP